MDDERHLAALKRVNGFMRQACPKGKQKATVYTQETHDAFKAMFAHVLDRLDAVERRTKGKK